MEYTKTHRLLRMLMLLSGSRRYTMQELETKLEMSERTVYRDLCIIEESGFLLDRENGAYRLQGNGATRNLQRLFHFSEEEACILYQTLSFIDGASPLKERLVRKLNSFYDLKVLERLRQSDDLAKVQTISDSIRFKKQVKLMAYRSSHSNSIEDRKVEAFDFLADYRAVWCYDYASGSCKQFKIARMQSVELSSCGWQYEARHQLPFTDVFRVSADVPLATVELLLSLKAYNLLIEEYPLSADYIVPENECYRLKVPVADFTGVGRFVLGLVEDVRVVAPDTFKNYLKKKLLQYRE